MIKQHALALLVAVVAFAPPPAVIAADHPGDAVELGHQYSVGEHFVYDATLSITNAQLRSKQHSRYTFDVDPSDPMKGHLRIEQDGRTNPPIPVTIRADGSWARSDGRTVPVLAGYDPSFMCKHELAVRAGDTWDCHFDGASQYLGAATADPGELHVKVNRVISPTSLELRISYTGQPRSETVLDEDTHQEVHIVKQTVRATDIIFDNGIITSITDHTMLGTRLPNLTTSVDVKANKTLVEHRK
jgi:hypothetical protein